MINKNQSNDLKKSLEIIREINWFDGIHKLPNDIDKKLLDQCSDIIQEFFESNEVSSVVKKSKRKPKIQKRQVSKIKKKPKRKLTKTKPTSQKLKKNSQSSNYAHNYPSTFPCFRSYGPINCPKNKLPMPRDLWYRIVYSQILEQQLESGDYQKRLSSKRKHKEDEFEIENLKKNNTNPHQQQTMNAVISSKIIKLNEKGDEQWHKSERNDINLQLDDEALDSYQTFSKNKLEYIPEILPLEIECKQSQSNLTNPKIDSKENLKTILSTQSDHVESLNRPQIYREISVDAILESNPSIENIPIPNAPSTSNFKEITVLPSNKNTSSILQFDHPLINQLIEYYNLDDIPRLQLFKQLNRRLKHIHQSLKSLSSNDIELKLKYKRDALVKKRQIPVQSLTKDERIAMAELELNVYEYVQALDEPSSKSFHINDNDILQTEPLLSTASILLSYDTVVPVVEETTAVIASESSIEPSVSTFNTVQPSTISQSTARLSTITQFSENTEKLASWTHPLESNLINMFEPLTPYLKSKIHKQLARRYEHISKKAQELSSTQIHKQIKSKSKALEQSKKCHQPNRDELLRIAELELSLFELRHEQTQRNQIDK